VVVRSLLSVLFRYTPVRACLVMATGRDIPGPRDGIFRGTGRDYSLTGPGNPGISLPNPGTIPGYFTLGQMEYFGMVNRGRNSERRKMMVASMMIVPVVDRTAYCIEHRRSPFNIVPY